MTRPCFLVIDREFAGSISTRKLVLETAKFNVITAYSSTEALETVRRFPAIDGAVIDSAMPDLGCDELVEKMRAIKPGLKVIAISSPGLHDCALADYQLESFAPVKLLELLQKLLPEQTEVIEENEIRLHVEEL